MNSVVIIAAAAILLWRSPFPLAFNLLLLSSYYVFFEYGVVARSYGLTVLLLFATAAASSARMESPKAFGVLLALLCNSSTPGLFFGSCLILIGVIEVARPARFNASRLTGIAIAGAGAFLAFLELALVRDGFVAAMPPIDHHAAFAYLLRNAIVPSDIFGALGLPFDATILNLIALLTALIALRSDLRALSFYAVGTASISYVYTIHYQGSLRHVGLLSVVLVVAHWLARERAYPLPIARAQPLPEVAHLWLVTACLAVSTILNTAVCRDEIRYQFSGSKEMADFIVEHDLSGRTIAAFPDPFASAVLPYLSQRRFWYAGSQSFGSHMAWDVEYQRNRTIPYPEAFRRIQEHDFSAEGAPLILFSEPIPSPERFGYRLLGQTEKPVFAQPEERYFLYERAPQLGLSSPPSP